MKEVMKPHLEAKPPSGAFSMLLRRVVHNQCKSLWKSRWIAKNPDTKSWFR